MVREPSKKKRAGGGRERESEKRRCERYQSAIKDDERGEKGESEENTIKLGNKAGRSENRGGMESNGKGRKRRKNGEE